ncbi:MAG: sulfate adenylyltransferase subunit CysD, partial [Polyangiales bacterium]
KIEATVKAELIKYTNPEGVAMGINPFDFGSKKYTDVMKTEALKQALSKYEFDCAFGGARRDEEKSRAKERIFSFRDSHHQWDPKNQRPELWNIFNAKIKKGENVRVFPLSNWTELDVWLYVWLEGIPVVPLYFAKERPVVERSGTWILVDDDRMRLEPGEEPQMKKVRFRTLGCYPLSGAVESESDTVPKVIQEMLLNRFSERQGRLIDFDEEGSMEVKKREGYF